MKSSVHIQNNAISIRISLMVSIKYMTFVAFITILVCSVFTGSLFFYVKKIRSDSLKDSSKKIMETISKDGIEELNFLELPYFIDCTVFKKEDEEILFTTNSLIPLLDFKKNKVFEYFEKGFYSDSDLKLSVLNNEASYRNEKILIQCVIDIENDSISKMIKGFPKVLLLCLLPILGVSFFISYLISKKTVQAFKKLESAFENEKAFSSNVSHELKTPLSIISGHANLIKRWGKYNPKQLEDSVNVILEETNNMTKIIQTLLELSKIEKGLIQIEKNSFFVSNLFAKLREEFKSIHKDLEILIEDEDFIEINTDEKILHQILTAVMSNSIKFYTSSTQSEASCLIILRAKKLNGKIHIEVQDNGSGFDEKILPFIFERFYKGEKSHTRNGSGAGLGLSISKSLTLALGGKISARNAENGGGIIELIF